MGIEQLTINSNWQDLNSFINQLKIDKPNKPIWQMLEERPFTSDSIKILLKEDWEVVEFPFTDGACIYPYERNHGYIHMPYSYMGSPFIRDLTLCHEFTHAWYPYFDETDREVNSEDELITEWNARQLRANPKILRELAGQFGGTERLRYTLNPIIYDRATLLAFGLHGYNIDQDLEECPKALRNIPLLMDVTKDNSKSFITSDDRIEWRSDLVSLAEYETQRSEDENMYLQWLKSQVKKSS